MRKIGFYLFILIFLGSCSASQKKNSSVDNLFIREYDINSYSQEEKKVINDFLKTLLAFDRYKPYQNHNLVIMEEAESRIGSIYAYNYCKDRDSSGVKGLYQACEIIPSKNEILKSKYQERPYFWKPSDFENKNISVLKTEELRASIKLGNYTALPQRLLVYASVPVLFEKDKAYFSFRSGNSFFGFGVIEMGIVSMKRNINGIWEVENFYFDPNIAW
ncbi:MAG: hypothetical protein RLZZ500_1397 [Bacteroidota bacterium]|jgi:hypothetical protein